MIQIQEVNDGIYDSRKYKTPREYMAECDKRQRELKQNDIFNPKVIRESYQEQAPMFKINEPLEIDDFKSFLCLISDLKVETITNNKLYLRNSK